MVAVKALYSIIIKNNKQYKLSNKSDKIKRIFDLLY